MGNQPWLEHYDSGVPPSCAPYSPKTLFDLVHEIAQVKPEQTALHFKGARMNYLAWDRLSDEFGAALAALGVRKGTVVALLLPNSPQFLIAEFGAHKAGAIACPLNPLYTARELADALVESGAEYAVVLARFYAKLKSIQPQTKVRGVICTGIKEYLPPALRTLYGVAREKKEGDRIRLEPGDAWLQDLLRVQRGQPRPAVTVAPDDPAVLLFSGGTTGTPKTAIGSHQALVMAGTQLHTWFKSVLVEWHDVIMLNLPLFHVYAQAGILPTGIVGHAPLALVPNPRDLDDLLSTIDKVRPAFLPGVPTLFNALANHPRVIAGKVNLRSIKLSISGAAPLHIETKHRFEDLTGGTIVEGYGMTETMMAAIVTPIKGVYKPGSTGLPLPDVAVRIVDSETGVEDLPIGQVGELLVSSPQNMNGYWQRPQETANAIRDGWIYTGDLARMDEDGYIFIVDRKKDVIKVSGFQVWPREVEEILAAHPAVQEVGVAGVSDPYQGEAVKAWIVLRPGMNASESELRAYCKEQLSGYKVPHLFEFRDSLPKSMVGKVLRRELVLDEMG